MICDNDNDNDIESDDNYRGLDSDRDTTEDESWNYSTIFFFFLPEVLTIKKQEGKIIGMRIEQRMGRGTYIIILFNI